jgi:hypothetical protein
MEFFYMPLVIFLEVAFLAIGLHLMHRYLKIPLTSSQNSRDGTFGFCVQWVDMLVVITAQLQILLRSRLWSLLKRLGSVYFRLIWLGKTDSFHGQGRSRVFLFLELNLGHKLIFI